MKTENLEKLKMYRSEARNLRTMAARFEQAAKNPKCDKHELGFGVDGRFSIFSVEKLSLDGYIGYYGSSGCSTFASVDRQCARELFIKALNVHRDAILKSMADFAEEAANSLKAAAEKELASLRALIDSAESSIIHAGHDELSLRV